MGNNQDPGSGINIGSATLVETQERAGVEKSTTTQSRAARDKWLHAVQERKQELPMGLPNRTRGNKLCLMARVGELMGDPRTPLSEESRDPEIQQDAEIAMECFSEIVRGIDSG